MPGTTLVQLERRGRLAAIVTQNIDGLHQAAGHDPAKVIEVHGTVLWSRCWGCSDRRPMAQMLDRVRAGEADPACERCGGIIKSDTILFGQSLVPDVIEAAMVAAERCDLLIAVGSTLSVFPAANVVPRAKSAGAGDHRQRRDHQDGPLRRLGAARFALRAAAGAVRRGDVSDPVTKDD